MPRRPSPLHANAEQAFAQLFVRLPSEYKSLIASLDRLDHAFRGKVATQLEQAINAHLAKASSTNLAVCDATAALIESAADRFGLAVTDPETGKPGVLVVEQMIGIKPPTGRYSVLIQSGPDGSGYRHSSTSRTLDDIHFQVATDEFCEWAREFRKGTPQRGR